MSKAEIIAELAKLEPEERQEIIEKIFQLDRLSGDEWLADAEEHWGTLTVAPDPNDPGTLTRTKVKTEL